MAQELASAADSLRGAVPALRGGPSPACWAAAIAEGDLEAAGAWMGSHPPDHIGGAIPDR